MNGKSKPIRGRPVGSGIDDRERLSQIAQMLASNPEMKPTTAIRAIGIVDPSAVRRLRDKLKSGHADTLRAAGASAESQARVQTMAASADNVLPFRISENVPPRGPSKAAPEAPEPRRQPANPTLLPLLELTIGTLTAALTLQQAMLGAMMQNPVFQTFLKQHIAGNEMLLSLLKIPVSPHRSV